MEPADEKRIDKWLWSVRVFKTRSLAADACKKGRVTINDNQVKPAKDVRIGDTVTVRKPPVVYTFKVLGIPSNRVGAKLIATYLENITPQSELDKLNPDFMAFSGIRERGAGRPTKKERRTLDEIKGASSFIDDWDED
jgi:ribosome-associated heat shock protein Hsp15